MARSHFGRFKEGVQISGVNLNLHQKGKVFYVGNSTVPAPNGLGASNNNSGLSPDAPFSTLDYAIGRCVASRGDKIIVLPGHAETISGAAGVAIDVAGVSIIGTGDGALKPTFSFSNTASTMTMSAANCSLKGVRLIATVDSVVAGLIISGANCEVDIETADTSAAVEFAIAIQTTAAADNLKLRARHRGYAAGDAMTRYIDIVGCRDALIDVDFFGKASVAVVNMRTTACDNVEVTGRFYNESAALTKNVVNSTTSTFSVEGYDAKAGVRFAGSDDVSVAAVGEAVRDPATFVPGLGYRVTKTEDVNTATSDDLFTVTGKVLITVWTCEVTNALDAAVIDYKIEMTTSNKVLLAAGNIASAAVGHMFQLNGDSASTALNTSTGAVSVTGEADNAGKGLAMRVVGKAGGSDVLKATRTAGAAGDAIVHTVFYLPLEASASIVAAA